MSDVVIAAAIRTPLGAFQGSLAAASAPQLGAAVTKAAIESAGVAGSDVEEVIFGCVLQADLGQAPARQAALAGGVPLGVPATTINKMCGSGLKAVMLGAAQIRSGDAGIVLAGGLESMSNAPYLLPKARTGLRMGHAELRDHMLRDGLLSPFDGLHMGVFADRTAKKHGFWRTEQDEFAAESVRRAVTAVNGGAFADEIVPVVLKLRKGDVTVDRDEAPFALDVARIPTLRPAFVKDGTVTPASSSSIADGAAAVVLMNGSIAASRGITPLARIVGYVSHAGEPEWFAAALVDATRKLLSHVGWHASDVDLFEINEAFAIVPMVAMRDMGIEHARLNVNGGACALGHPIGATGARILTTLIHALRKRGGKRGVAALCLGGGEAVAVAIEII
ncbi:acetyl-CoA C-acyltransferase [Povalibacter sp.]|uniref:thiolase family protein n=1 Tax=Povalibacter sp. TaxID=1962978 RepID=UPI002F41E519